MQIIEMYGLKLAKVSSDMFEEHILLHINSFILYILVKFYTMSIYVCCEMFNIDYEYKIDIAVRLLHCGITYVTFATQCASELLNIYAFASQIGIW